jgi:hypothetical protein
MLSQFNKTPQISKFMKNRSAITVLCYMRTDRYDGGKVKVRISLGLIKHHAFKTYVSGNIVPPFLTSTLTGGKW